jgi:hypothetical protein
LAYNTINPRAEADTGILFAEVSQRAFITAGYITTTRGPTFTECTQEAFGADSISPLVDATITVVVFTITDLVGLISTEATQVTCPFIDHTVAVVIFTITSLSD